MELRLRQHCQFFRLATLLKERFFKGTKENRRTAINAETEELPSMLKQKNCH